MAFKKAPRPTLVPDSPDKLFLDLPRRNIPDVLPHQREVMRTYAAEALNLPDVALQLPTGSGKTADRGVAASQVPGANRLPMPDSPVGQSGGRTGYGEIWTDGTWLHRARP